MKNGDKLITTYNLSREAFEKLDRIAYNIDKSRSNTLNHILMNLSEYTLTRYAKRSVKGDDKNGHNSRV